MKREVGKSVDCGTDRAPSFLVVVGFNEDTTSDDTCALYFS